MGTRNIFPFIISLVNEKPVSPVTVSPPKETQMEWIRELNFVACQLHRVEEE
jgi:hypothetical protein